jgi:hypothetical protein
LLLPQGCVVMRYARRFVAGVSLALAFSASVLAAESDADRFLPLSRLIGEWTGTAVGEAGTGTITRTYAFVMNGRFVSETNTTRYPPQEKNKSGEVHEHWGIFSYDKARKLIVLRQFHQEGFVNTYRQAGAAEAPASLVFESEAFENFSNKWKARESYEFRSDDEFVELFELSAPGGPFQVYSRSEFKRSAK